MNKFPISPLFIPGNKIEWIAKTFDKGADSIIVDLEDSVPLVEKIKPGNPSSPLAQTTYEGILIVRTNPISDESGQLDIEL